MGQFDTPQNKDVARQEVSDPAAAERMKLFHDLMDDRQIGIRTSRDDGPLVSNIGQVDSMSMPDRYEVGKKVAGTYANNFFQDYHLKDDPDVKIYFEYRGRTMSEAPSRNFRDVLSQPAHLLDSAEQAKLANVFGGYRSNPDDFKVLLAKTEDLNGKRVLILEGRDTKRNTSSRTMYIDSDGSGSAIQEITYQAPTKNYLKNLTPALHALKTIKWK
jgi:hypothetical protein